jgi:HrpA-like RNA helicase
LENSIQPPDKQAVQAAINRLVEFKALDNKQQLTPLGYHLASLSVDSMLVACAVCVGTYRFLCSSHWKNAALWSYF